MERMENNTDSYAQGEYRVESIEVKNCKRQGFLFKERYLHLKAF